MEFILSDKKDLVTGCLFCTKAADTRDRENLVLRRRKHTYTIMNLYPYNNGHLMVVPLSHTGNIEDLDAETAAEVMHEVQHSVAVLRRLMAPDGFNIGVNIGRPAGAGVEGHVHVHIVPRWVGDSNFMPVLGETRLIPEDLATTYDRLLAAGFAE